MSLKTYFSDVQKAILFIEKYKLEIIEHYKLIKGYTNPEFLPSFVYKQNKKFNYLVCDCCGNKKAIEKIEDCSFYYGENLLKLDAPVITCSDCNFSYTDYRTEDLKTKAIKQLQNPVSLSST